MKHPTPWRTNPLKDGYTFEILDDEGRVVYYGLRDRETVDRIVNAVNAVSPAKLAERLNKLRHEFYNLIYCFAPPGKKAAIEAALDDIEAIMKGDA
jgi:hypothetical protein